MVARRLPQPAGQAIVHLTNPAHRAAAPRAAARSAGSIPPRCVAVILVAVARGRRVCRLSGLGLPPGADLGARWRRSRSRAPCCGPISSPSSSMRCCRMVAPGGYSPLQSLLTSLCEPVLRPFRRIIPPLGGLDLSPLWAGIIQALLRLLLILLKRWIRPRTLAARDLTFAEHTLSDDFAPKSQHSQARTSCAAVTSAPGCKLVQRKTLQKKAFARCAHARKRLPKRAHVLFCAPILFTR